MFASSPASPARDRVAVVVCTDDTLRLTRNGTLIRELCWPLDALDECMAQFLELVHLASPHAGR
jgi:hypothetical protein